MDWRALLRRDWLMLNASAVRNALVASAQAAQRAEDRADAVSAVERSLRRQREQELSQAL